MALDGDPDCVYPIGEVSLVRACQTLGNGDRVYRLPPKTKWAAKVFARRQFVRVGSSIGFAEAGNIGGNVPLQGQPCNTREDPKVRRQP